MIGARHWHWRCVPVAGKVPLVRDWPRRATSDRDVWRAWLARWPRAALALATGRDSGVLAIDVDAPGRDHAADGRAALAELERRLGPLPPTVSAATPSGGRHLLLAWPQGVDRIPSRPLTPGVDVRASGALLVLPTGARTPQRRWLAAPGDVELAAVPVRWLAVLLPPPPRPCVMPRLRRWSRDADDLVERARCRVAAAAERVRRAAPGCRHHTLVSAARLAGGLAAAAGIDVAEIEATLLAAAQAAGLDAREARAAVRWGLVAGAGAPVSPAVVTRG